MAKKMYIKSSDKSIELPSIDFNGITLVRSKVGLETFYEDKVSDFMEKLVSAETNYPDNLNHTGDSIKLHRNGSLRIDGTHYQINEIAFNQILSYLGVPIKFCARLPRSIFIELINTMLGEQYDKNFDIKVITGSSPNVIIGFHPKRKMTLPTAYSLFSQLIREQDMEDRKTSFMAGVINGMTYALYLVFDDHSRFKEQSKDDYKGPFIWPGVEILFSPTFQVKPTVTACILGENCAALNRNLSFKMDLKTTGMNKVIPVFETFIRDAKSGNEEMIKAFEKSFSTDISEKINSIIHKKLPKVINGRLSGTSFVGKNASEVLSEISNSGVNDTLGQRRKTLFFIWDILKEL